MAAYTAIDDPEAYFQVKLYSGTGSEQSITLDGDTDMQPDLVWAKTRNDTQDYQVIDAVRGATKLLATNGTAGEFDDANNLTAFNSDGFTVGTSGGINGSSDTLVAWCWKESAVSGVDIISFEGTGSAHTEAHSLSAVPHMVIAKNRERTADWLVYHAGNDVTGNYTLFLHSTSARDASQNYWNDTAPTSSVFSVGNRLENNQSGEDIIAYAFAPKQGFSKFGIFEGNGDADGPFIYLGFRPAFVLWKNAEYAENWHLIDNKRSTFNLAKNGLTLNENYAASDDANIQMDFLSNGIKIRSASHATSNVSGNFCVFMAFAEAPLVNSNGVPCNAR